MTAQVFSLTQALFRQAETIPDLLRVMPPGLLDVAREIFAQAGADAEIRDMIAQEDKRRREAGL